MKERLQKILARAGVASRRAAERLILEGRVRVNGEVVRVLGTRAEASRDRIEVDGTPLPRRPPARVYAAYSKPRGVVSTLADPEGRPHLGPVARRLGRGVFAVGRLDYHSEGLILLTNDGELARFLTHPASGVEKVYHVKVRGRPEPPALERLRTGVPLDGRPARVERVRVLGRERNTWLEVVVSEGRKHLVRKLLQAVGHPVMRLRRVEFAGIRLEGLAPGEVRILSGAEVGRLRRLAGEGGRRKGGAA